MSAARCVFVPAVLACVCFPKHDVARPKTHRQAVGRAVERAAEGLLDDRERLQHDADIQAGEALAQDAMHVLQVLGPAGQHLGDDQVFGADDRHRDIPRRTGTARERNRSSSSW